MIRSRPEPQIGDNSGSPVTAATEAAGQMRSYFERWQRLEEEKANVAEDLKNLFAEAKGFGFNTKAMRAVFRAETGDKSAQEEFDTICELYREALAPARPAPARVEKITEFHPAPHLSAGDDGRLSIPSPDADGAKMEGRLVPVSPERAADEAGHISVQSGQAVEDFQPPAFLIVPKKPSDYRPHCLHPEACGSSQLKHCHQCAKAAGLEAVA